MDTYAIYKHTSPSGKVYIGLTRNGEDPEKRWKRGWGYDYNIHFFNAIKKYGWDAFEHEVLMTNLSKEEASSWEIALIAQYDSANRDKGYNVSPGGGIITEEIVRKGLETKRANGSLEASGVKAKKRWANPEYRERTVSHMKGRPVSDEQREHYRKGATGKVFTEEHRKHISEARKKLVGEKSPRSKPVCQIDPETLEVVHTYINAREAAMTMGDKSLSAIASICRGEGNKRGFKHGFYWCYKEDLGKRDFSKEPEVTPKKKLVRTNSSWKGRHHTEEAKAKMSAVHSKPVQCIETGKCYKNIREAAKENGIKCPETISRQIKGEQKHANGLHWRYVDGL